MANVLAKWQDATEWIGATIPGIPISRAVHRVLQENNNKNTPTFAEEQPGIARPRPTESIATKDTAP